MISYPDFWQDESNSLLMDKNSGFITEESAETIIQRAQIFKELIQEKTGEEVSFNIDDHFEDEEILRLLRLDAERTFKTEKFRDQSISTLKSICSHIKDYHQGMGFITSFLLLFLDPIETSQLVLALDKFYIPGYFKSVAKNYFRDAKVFGKILKIYNSKVYHHIATTIAPETYCSKWFVGMNVHVLPFEALITFLENFFREGDNYLFCFGLSLIKNCEPDIICTKDVSKILAILRLDSKFYCTTKCTLGSRHEGSFFLKIVNDALDIQISKDDITRLRAETKIEMDEEEERRKKREEELENFKSDDEIVFSDEE